MKNIIFDLGNVLIEFNPKAYIAKHVPKEYGEDFYQHIFPTQEWLDLDRGTLSYEDAKAIFKQRLPQCANEIDDFLDYKFFDMLMPIWKNVQILEDIAKTKKYKLYILSNFHKDAIEEMKHRYRFFDYFDDGLISCYCNLLKPDSAIYQHLIDKFKIDPKETIFIDDTEINVVNAEKLGIKGIHLPDYNELRNKINACKIL